MAVVLCFWAFPVFLLFSLRVGVPAVINRALIRLSIVIGIGAQIAHRWRLFWPPAACVLWLLALLFWLSFCSFTAVPCFVFVFIFFSFFGCFFVTRVWFLVDSSSLCCFCIVFFGRPCQSFCCCHYRASASLPLIFLSITMVSCLPFFCGC